ncbi:MAG: hypothetical protein QF406_13680 [Verrucomicrobiota bacterium]|jgi:hypothetical protein|nr:hypothetical protein [Verrucomicrobiota bacterium]
MRLILLLGLLISSLSTLAAVPLEKQQFVLKKPTPKWFGERIALPPKGFAPDLGLKGIEEILFAPGMFKADQPDFFSYVFLFALEAKPKLDAKVLKKELFTYYSGLSKARMGNPKLDTSGFSVKVTAIEDKVISPKESVNVKNYRAEIMWLEPFATKKMQTLYFELQTWEYKDSPYQYLFVCASPQKSEKPLWKTLRDIRAEVVIKPAE